MSVRSVVVAGLLLVAGCSGNDSDSAGSTAHPTLPSTTVGRAAAPSDEPRVPADSAVGIDPSDVSTTGVIAPVPSKPSASTRASVPPGAVIPAGFDPVRASVTTADGDVCELCVWLAETPEQRGRGLMYATDLGAADGMAFVYPEPTATSFWMKDTPMPLSIAFFGVDGDLLDAFDMDPCVDRGRCPSYPTPRNFTVALEVPQGMLVDSGIAAGATLVVTDLPCHDAA